MAAQYRLECSVSVPESDGTGERSGTRPNGMTVIAALHDPLAVLLANDFTDVVPPDDDCAYGWATGI